MNIGIDLDGVVFDSEKIFRSYMEIFDIQHHGDGIIDYTEMLPEKRYGWNKEQYAEFINRYVPHTIKTAPLLPCCEYVLRELKKQGHKLYAITARGLAHPKEISITKRLMHKYKLPFDDVIYNAHDKLSICKELNIDLFIDDRYDNVLKLGTGGVKCIYFKDIELKDIDNPNVTTVKNWGEIYRLLLSHDK